ncbi:MAG: DUF3426 domain-containing protein [Burkholderiales bacterium]|nr:DUF3426 domain-containing protein [Burkholderiales bacterium]
MPLMTRCSHCQTVFRITPEQLRVHGGRVRCGRCLQVFNGLETLVPDVQPPAATAMAVDPVPADLAPDTPVPADGTAVTGIVVESVIEDAAAAAPAETAPAGPSAGLTDILPEPSEMIPEAPLAVRTPGEAGEAKAEAEMQVQVEAAAAPAEEPAGNPFMQEDVMPATESPRRPWLLAASVLLALVLGAQAIYFYRGDIAARHPQARQWLNAACAQMACTVPLPQLPKSVLIEASDLQLADPARPERIQLTATLRNHAGHAVAYPALDLVLTNANDHTLARRIFLPAEYLGGGRDPQGGLAANAELTVRLALDTGNLGAAGFRLAVLAAPR